MKTTMHAHRLYLVMAVAAATLLVMAGPAAAGTDVPRARTGSGELDGWVSGAARNEQPAPVDAWARREVARSSGYDAWASGRMRAAALPRSTTPVEQAPATTPMTPGPLALGLLAAAVFGATAALAAGHRRRTSSAN